MSRLPSLAALRAFECVARHKSFTNAADEMCVTVPALSHHVKALELELGQKVFVRLHRSIKLTNAGQILYDATERAFSTLGDTWDHLLDTSSPVKMSAGIHFMTNWLAPRSARLQLALASNVIDHITTFEKLNFEAGEVDLAIRNGNQKIQGLFCETIYEEWWTPMVAPSVAKRLREPTDLLKFPIVEARHPREPKGHPSMADWLRAAGVSERHSNIQEITHTETAMQMAVSGTHVKLCASVLSGELHKEGKLVIPFKTAIRREGIRFYLICRTGEENEKPIETVRSFLRAEFDAMDKAMGFDQMSLIELPDS